MAHLALRRLDASLSPAWVRWLPWVLLSSCAVLWAARWPTFPLALDPAYHLSVAQQMVLADGPLAYEWWECAPVGRPHLYPPVLHLLLAGLLTLTNSPIGTIRLATALIVPLVLLTIYVAARRLFSASIALACVLMALVSFAWWLQLGMTLAAGLGLIELLWLMVAMREQRWIAASCLFALLWYTHLGLPVVAVVTLVAGCGLRAIATRHALATVGWGGLIALPWLVHVGRHAGTFRAVSRYENTTIEVVPLLLLLGVVGVWHSWKARGRGEWLLSLWLGFCAYAANFSFRWLSGEGVLPIVLLAGYAVERLSTEVAEWLHHRVSRWTVMLAMAGAMMVSPSWSISPSGVHLRWLDAAPFHLLNWSAPAVTDRAIGSAGIERLSKLVERVTHPAEILWSNAPYAGGLVAALAHRPTASAMFYEVPPARPFDPVGASRWILWFKIGPQPGAPTLEELRRRHALELAADEELALVFRNPGARDAARSPEAVVPLWAAFVLLCAVCVAIAGDFTTHGKTERNLHQR